MSPTSPLSRFLPRALSRALSPLHSASHSLPSLFGPTSPSPPQADSSMPASNGSLPLAPPISPGTDFSPAESRTHALSAPSPSQDAPLAATPLPQAPSGPSPWQSSGGVRCLSSVPGAAVYNVGSSTNIKWHETKVPKDVRQGILNQKGCVIWFTGLSGSGKSTLAYTLEHALIERGRLAYVLDGDNVRHGLNKNLGFSAADREENIRRVGEVAKLFADAGIITIVSFISPYRRDRQAARELLPDGEFLEVFMKIPLSVCEQRDPKGLYKLARSGKLKGFTGIDDPYEEPEKAEVVIEVSKEDGVLQAPEVMAQTLLSLLEEKEIVPPAK